MSTFDPPPASDEAVIASIALGEEGALEELARRYAGECKAVALRVLSDPSEAEAIAWRVLEEIWENRDRWTIRSPRAFLMRRCRSLALGVLRARIAAHQRHREWARHVAVAPPPPDIELQREDMRCAMSAEITKLPPRRKEAFLLRVVEGKTFREVAEAMGTSPRTAEHQVAAAIATLRDSLRPLIREWLGRASGDR